MAERPRQSADKHLAGAWGYPQSDGVSHTVGDSGYVEHRSGPSEPTPKSSKGVRLSGRGRCRPVVYCFPGKRSSTVRRLGLCGCVSISPPRPRLAPPGVSTGWPGRPIPEPALEGDETGAVGPHPQSLRDGDESTTERTNSAERSTISPPITLTTTSTSPTSSSRSRCRSRESPGAARRASPTRIVASARSRGPRGSASCIPGARDFPAGQDARADDGGAAPASSASRTPVGTMTPPARGAGSSPRCEPRRAT